MESRSMSSRTDSDGITTTTTTVRRADGSTTVTTTKSRDGEILSEETHTSSGSGGGDESGGVADFGDFGADFAAEYERMREQMFGQGGRELFDGEEGEDASEQEPNPVENPDEAAAEILAQINEKRALHGAEPLQLDAKLCDVAQEWAAHLAESGRLQHRPASRLGENIAAGSGNMVARAVPLWYGETERYDYSQPGFQPGTGHFSQLVWKASKLLGVGVAAGQGMTFVVTNFQPAGNVAGRYEQNVAPPQ